MNTADPARLDDVPTLQVPAPQLWALSTNLTARHTHAQSAENLPHRDSNAPPLIGACQVNNVFVPWGPDSLLMLLHPEDRTASWGANVGPAWPSTTPSST